jgi:hypothetical protein
MFQVAQPGDGETIKKAWFFLYNRLLVERFSHEQKKEPGKAPIKPNIQSMFLFTNHPFQFNGKNRVKPAPAGR